MAVNTAVILAAGLGSRLKERTKDIPKGFLEIEDKAIVELSIQKLIEAGISRIVIGTGYLSEQYDQLKAKYPQIITCKSERFAETGSMYTLYNLRHLIDTDFLLLESDLIYDKSGLVELISDPHPDVILASGKTGSKDEVYIQTNEDGNLVNMSKITDELDHISGELVGISKVSLPTFRKMVAFAKASYKQEDLDIHYEDDFVGISSEIAIYIKIIEGYAWCEIDDENHLNRALSLVYPRIVEAENL